MTFPVPYISESRPDHCGHKAAFETGDCGTRDSDSTSNLPKAAIPGGEGEHLNTLPRRGQREENAGDRVNVRHAPTTDFGPNVDSLVMRKDSGEHAIPLGGFRFE